MSRQSLLDELTDANLSKLTTADVKGLTGKLAQLHGPKTDLEFRLSKQDRNKVVKYGNLLDQELEIEDVVNTQKAIVITYVSSEVSSSPGRVDWDDQELVIAKPPVPLAKLPKAKAAVDKLNKLHKEFDTLLKSLSKKYGVAKADIITACLG